MILGILAVLVSFLLFWLLAGYIPLAWHWYQRTAFAVAGAVVGTGWLLFLMAFILDMQAASLTVFAVELIAVVVLATRARPRLLTPPPSRMNQAWKPYTYAAAAFMVVMAVYFAYTHFFMPGSNGWYSAGYTWADLALHTSLISWFAEQPVLRLVLPVFPDAPLTYPFITNLYSAWLVRMGLSLQWSIVLPSIALLCSFGVLLASLVFRLTQSLRAAWLSIPIVILTGSNIGFTYFISAWMSGDLSRVWLGTDYSQLPEYNLNVPSLLTSHLLPQRTFLLGSVAVFAVLILLFEYVRQKNQRLLIIACSIGALLPFVHVHSAFVVGLVLLITLLMQKDWRGLWYVAGMVLVMAPQLYWQFSGSYHADFGGVHLWWYTPEGGNPLLYWLENIGFLAVISLLGVWLASREQRANTLLWVLLAVAIIFFVAGNFYQFHPNLWDTMKFFSYSFIVFGIFAALAIAWLSRQRTLGVVVASLALVLLTGSGALAVIREQMLHWEFISTEEQQFAQLVKERVPVSARILTTPRHNHPVSILSGREVMLGYEGWMWSYGIDVTEEGQALRQLWSGQGNLASLRARLGVDYAVISDAERSEYMFNEAAFSKVARLLAREGKWSLYQFTE
jgi:hypothetical protein